MAKEFSLICGIQPVKKGEWGIEAIRDNAMQITTQGLFRFHALGPIYYRSSNGAVLVYDITDQDSFEKVKNWVKELQKMLGNEVVLVIVGNKTDLEKDRNVNTEEAEEYATSVGARYFETSAKLNVGIEDVFLDLSAAVSSLFCSYLY